MAGSRSLGDILSCPDSLRAGLRSSVVRGQARPGSDQAHRQPRGWRRFVSLYSHIQSQTGVYPVQRGCRNPKAGEWSGMQRRMSLLAPGKVVGHSFRSMVVHLPKTVPSGKGFGYPGLGFHFENLGPNPHRGEKLEHTAVRSSNPLP